jgi:hypothetical protein
MSAPGWDLPRDGEKPRPIRTPITPGTASTRSRPCLSLAARWSRIAHNRMVSVVSRCCPSVTRYSDTPVGPLAGLGVSTTEPMKWVSPRSPARSSASWEMSSHSWLSWFTPQE